MASRCHNDFPDLTERLCDDCLVWLDHYPADAQIKRYYYHQQSIQNGDADQLGHIVRLWPHSLLIKCVFLSRELNLLQAPLNFLLVNWLVAAILLNVIDFVCKQMLIHLCC